MAPAQEPQPCILTTPGTTRQIPVGAIQECKHCDVYEVINYSLTNAYLWSPTLGRKLGTYDRVDNTLEGYTARDVSTTHSCGYPGFFKPDVAETRGQIDPNVSYFTSDINLNEDGSPSLTAGGSRQNATTLCFYEK